MPDGTCPPGTYVDEIIYHAEDVGDGVIRLYTTPDFVELTLQDTIMVHQNGAFECLKSSAPEYDRWVGYGKPDCWCCRRQCRGDIDCITTGPFPVALPDLILFKAAFNQVVLPDPPGVCADLDHGNIGPFPCGIPDLQIFKSWFNQVVVPCCDLDGDCILTPADKYNFWTN
ncbi:MAG: hypothetical protein ACYST6_13360 [Planctomycetota bacterium]|jgi:hypothetical protein